jgi:phosphatidylinositol-3-phosphatase
MVTQPDAPSRAALATRTTEPPRLPSTQPTARWFKHVVVIVLENQDYEKANKDRFLRQLAKEGASFTHFYALIHPSQPNYLALVGGRLFGEIDPRDGDANVNLPDDGRHPSLADGLEAKGLTWKNYAEDYPAGPGRPPFLGAACGRYARKHVPFISFERVQRTRADHIIPVDPRDPDNRFVTDARNGALPSYAFYSPNLDHDGHDPVWPPSVGLGKASAWLKDFLTNQFPPACRKDTLVAVTFDESYNREPTNRIYTVLLGDMMKPAAEQNPAVLDVPYTHYDLLRTIEENFALEPLAEGDRTARPITGIWR